MHGEDSPLANGIFHARFLSGFSSNGGVALAGAIPRLFVPRNCGQLFSFFEAHPTTIIMDRINERQLIIVFMIFYMTFRFLN